MFALQGRNAVRAPGPAQVGATVAAVVRRAAGSVTPADLRVLDFITEFETARGRPPALREIAEGLGWRAHATAQRHVDALVASGSLVRGTPAAGTLSRGAGGAPQLVPLVGEVRRGQPLVGERYSGPTVGEPIPMGPGAFAVTVEDDAMQPSGLAAGAIAYAVPDGHPESGRVVVARIEGPGDQARLLVRRYEVRPRGPVLLADAAGHRSVRVREAGDVRVSIEGVVRYCVTVIQ
ncbi:MAG: LexA family protein [Candidatus Dormibacteria bacterium]